MSQPTLKHSTAPDCHSVCHFIQLTSKRLQAWNITTHFVICKSLLACPTFTTRQIQKLAKLKIHCLVGCQGDKVPNACQLVTSGCVFLNKAKWFGQSLRLTHVNLRGSKQTSCEAAPAQSCKHDDTRFQEVETTFFLLTPVLKKHRLRVQNWQLFVKRLFHRGLVWGEDALCSSWTGRHRRNGNSSLGTERGMCLQAFFMCISVSCYLERDEFVTALSLIWSSV